MSEYQDRGYAWVVLVACFFLNIINAGYFLVGVFLVEFQQHLSVSRVAVSWAGALHLCVGPICGVFLGPVMRRCGSRPLVMGGCLLIVIGFLVPAFFPRITIVYIFLGIFASMGYMATYNASILVVQQYFSRRRALANGIYMAGFSSGMLALPPLLRFTMDTYGWRGGLVVMAGVVMQGVFLGALLRPIPAGAGHKGIQHTSGKNESNTTFRVIIGKLFCNLPLLMFLMGDFGVQIGNRTVMVYTPMRCDMSGMTKTEAMWLMSTIGLAGLVAYPVTGWLADRPGINRLVIYGLGAMLAGITTLVTTCLRQFYTLLIGMILLSSFNTTSSGTGGPVIRAIVGLGQLEFALGMRVTVSGIGNIIFNVTSGYLFDYTGNPNAPFYVFGTTQVLGGLLVATIPLITRHRLRQQKRIRQEDETETSRACTTSPT